ncbi:MAG: arsenate reductase [Thioalkalivibrio sp.]|nr:arsenate reductase [Thioalkalivibrio sp.]
MSERVLYGLPGCDAVHRARRALDAASASYRFVDLRKGGVAQARLRCWADGVGWEALVNRRGSTWRRLPREQREGLDRERAIGLMFEYPARIKHPAIEHGKTLRVGWGTDHTPVTEGYLQHPGPC